MALCVSRRAIALRAQALKDDPENWEHWRLGKDDPFLQRIPPPRAMEIAGEMFFRKEAFRLAEHKRRVRCMFARAACELDRTGKGVARRLALIIVGTLGLRPEGRALAPRS